MVKDRILRDCVSCGQKLNATAVFCASCGVKQPSAVAADRSSAKTEARRFCTACGFRMNAKAMVCTRCGVSMNPPFSAGSAIVANEKTLAMFCHLLAIFFGFLAPLILWLVGKEDSSLVDEHGKSSLNFQLTVLIGYLLSGGLAFVVIGAFTAVIIYVGSIIFCVIASIKAYNGESFKYPLTINFIK